MTIGALVLAAGEGRRFGGTKQLAELDGRPLLSFALAAVAGISPRVVVLGHAADEVAAGVDLHGARPVVCADWAEGQAASLTFADEGVFNYNCALHPNMKGSIEVKK